MIYKDYDEDGFLPIMVMYDGTASANYDFAREKGLNFPVLSDTSMSLFERWDPSGTTPSTTVLDFGAEVHAVDTTWYTAMIEDLLYE